MIHFGCWSRTFNFVCVSPGPDDGNALLVRTPTSERDTELEEVLAGAFPDTDLRRLVPASSAAVGGYQLRFSLPQSLEELRDEMVIVRSGLVKILSRFEPKRIQDLDALLSTFGERETLSRLRPGRASSKVERIPTARVSKGTVH